MRAFARPRTALHKLFLGFVVAAVASGGLLGLESPAQANHRPDSSASAWSGFAFDTCSAPSQRVMDRWLRSSPFLGVGVYIGGSMRACGQPHLTRRWVSRQSDHGWKVLPIWVGPQASCASYRIQISPRPGERGLYPAARQQGARAARGAVAAARSLGIGRGTTLWYDLEAFSHRSTHCRRSALRFLSAWTTHVHRLGYRSGVYSSISAAVQALDGAGTRGPRGFVMPDHIWFAWANGRAEVDLGQWVRSPRWRATSRVHQYTLNSSASYGGSRLSIDKNFVSLGRPHVESGAAARCGVRLDFNSYGPVARGSNGARANAAQCLLRPHGYRGDIGGGFDATGVTAVRRFQADNHLPRTGRVDQRTWLALLSSGGRPVVKRGSAGEPVRRVQRALNAALPGALPVTGVFGARTAAAVRRYQQRLGLHATGVVAAPTWSALRQGRTTHQPGHRAKRHAAAHHRGGEHRKHSTKRHHGKPHKPKHHKPKHHKPKHHKPKHHKRGHQHKAEHHKPKHHKRGHQHKAEHHHRRHHDKHRRHR